MLPPELNLNPDSMWRRGFLLLVFFAAAIACISLQAFIAVALLAILLIFYWRDRTYCIRLKAEADGTVCVWTRKGECHSATVLPSSVVSEWLIVLHLLLAGRRCCVVLWPDSSPAESLRLWRGWLRWVWPSS